MIIRNALIVTMNRNSEIFRSDILVQDDRIASIKSGLSFDGHEEFDGTDYIVIPGLIQTHIHLCQTLFRNLADDLPLMDWLKLKIWPMEGKHTPQTLRTSAQMGISELLLGGTTTIMDMGTVHHMDVVFEELEKSGIRAFCGKTMMDAHDTPAALYETTDQAIGSSLTLLEKWHNKANGRIKYALAPRFALSCTKELLTETAKLAEKYNIPYHTHAAETRHEIDVILQRYNLRNISFFREIGASRANLCLAHCVWVDEMEMDILRDDHINVLHCPSSNLKLGSGIAPIPEYLDRGITVSLGADGAPCNNNLNIFQEMRLAALIQKPRHGPESMNAYQVFRLATTEGAKTLKLEDEIGSIEVGKKADLTFLKINQIPSIPFENIYAKIVYSTNQDAVEHVMIDGKWVVRNRDVINYDLHKLTSEINSEVKTFIN